MDTSVCERIVCWLILQRFIGIIQGNSRQPTTFWECSQGSNGPIYRNMFCQYQLIGVLEDLHCVQCIHLEEIRIHRHCVAFLSTGPPDQAGFVAVSLSIAWACAVHVAGLAAGKIVVGCH